MSSSLFLVSSSKDLRTEENEIHRRKEKDKNDQGQKLMSGGEGGEKHHGKTENDRREILIDHVVGGRGLKLAVDLTKKDGAGRSRTRQHTVHHEELLLGIFGEKHLCHNAVVNIGDDKSRYAKNDDHTPIVVKKTESNGGDARHDHDVKAYIADSGHQEVVDMLLLHCARLFQKANGKLHKCRRQNAQKEVKAINGGAHAGQNLTQNVDEEIGQKIRKSHKRTLHGELIDASLHGDLVLLFDSVCFLHRVLVEEIDLDPFANDVQMNHTAEGCRKEAECCDGKPKALTADKAVLDLINVTVVHRLSRTLSVAEGQKHARSGKEVGKDKGGDHGNTKPENGLQKIGRDGRHARVEDLGGALLGQFPLSALEGGGNKAER